MQRVRNSKIKSKVIGGLVYTSVAVEGPHGQRRCCAEEWNGNADVRASGEKVI